MWNERSVETLAGTGAPGQLDTRTLHEKPKASVLLTSLLPAEFALPRGVTCDGRGGAVVGDTGNGLVRHVSSEVQTCSKMNPPLASSPLWSL